MEVYKKRKITMSKEKEIEIEETQDQQVNTEAPDTGKTENTAETENSGNSDDSESSENSDNSEPTEEKDPLEAVQEENAKLRDQLLRTIAEFDNYKKRTLKEKTELILNGGEKTITAILPILDDFERAIADTNDRSATTGDTCQGENAAAIKEGGSEKDAGDKAGQRPFAPPDNLSGIRAFLFCSHVCNPSLTVTAQRPQHSGRFA